MDDVSRLVSADRLEDQGDLARATVIRHHVELSALPEWSARRMELEHAVRVLCAEHDRRWRAELPRIPGVRFGSFGSGDVQTVFASRLEDVARLGDVMDTRHLRRLVLHDYTEQTLAHALDVDWVRSFTMSDVEALDLVDLERLLHLPFMAHVRELGLPYAEIQSEGAEVIARATHLRLTHLDLQDCYVGGGASARLAAAPHLSGLEELVLECNGSGYVDDPMVDDRGLAAVLEGLPALRRLRIGGTRITDAGIRDLFSRDLPLEHLDIGNLPLDGVSGCTGGLRLEVFECMGSIGRPLKASATGLSELKALRLSSWAADAGAVDTLLDGVRSETLHELRLSQQGLQLQRFTQREWPCLHTVGVGAPQVAAVLGASLPALRTLDLRNGGPLDVRRLGRVPGLEGVRVLRADLTGSDPRDVAGLLTRTPGLTALQATGMAVTPEVEGALGALTALTDLSLRRSSVPASWPGWLGDRLILLGFDECGLTAESMRGLVRRPWSRLHVLRLPGNEPAYPGFLADLVAHAPDLRELEVADPDAPPRHYPVRQLRIAALDVIREPGPPEWVRGPLDPEPRL